MIHLIFLVWITNWGVQDPHELIRYCSPIYVLCVSSHFWPFTRANLILEIFNKNLGFGQTPPPLVGPNAQPFPKSDFDGSPKMNIITNIISDFIFTGLCLRLHQPQNLDKSNYFNILDWSPPQVVLQCWALLPSQSTKCAERSRKRRSVAFYILIFTVVTWVPSNFQKTQNLFIEHQIWGHS